MKAEITLEHAFDGNGCRVRALLRLSGEAPADAGRVPLNLCLVLDRSGSMAGEKLRSAREAAADLVRRLWPRDVVSVVAYDAEIETVAPPARGHAQADLSRRLRSIRSGGTTNLSGGWLRGLDLVEGGLREGAVNRVLLLTDGLANRGITDPDRLVGLCLDARRRGATTTTLGFGTDYDEDLLRAMADAGGGATYYIERADQAANVFAEELEGLLCLSAQNVAVEVRPSADVRLAAVHHGYPRSEVPGGLRLEVGDLYAREPRPLLAEFWLPDATPSVEVEVGRIEVTAHVVAADGRVERRRIDLPIRMVPEEGGRVDPEVRREALLLEAARARDDAAAADPDDPRAAPPLRETAARLREAAAPDDAALREEAEDLERLAASVEARGVMEEDVKYLKQRAYDARRGRRSASERIARTRREE